MNHSMEFSVVIGQEKVGNSCYTRVEAGDTFLDPEVRGLSLSTPCVERQ